MSGSLIIYDYIAFSLILAISFSIGIYMGFRKNETEDDYFLARRAFGFLPVGLSLLTTLLEPITILGYSAEAYANGIQLLMYVVSSIPAILLTTETSVPVLYQLQITSINEYFELRFESKFLRKTVMFLTAIRKTFFAGLVLYTPALALSAVTPIDSLIYIFIIGVVCTVYASLGGMRGVITTDVFQMSISLFGMVAVFIICLIQVGSLQEIWTIGKNGGRLEFFNMNPSLHERHNVYNVLVFGFLIHLNYYVGAQEVFQRLSTVKTLKDAKRVAYINAAGLAIFYPIFFFLGIVVYVHYFGCDPLKLGKISKADQILPYFIMEKTAFIYGFPGFFIGIIFASTLSTLSSIINCVVAIFWKDFLQELDFFKKMNNVGVIRTAKFLSFIFGSLMIGTAILFSKLGRIIQISFSLISIMGGPICGTFILGLCFPKCKAKGAILGLLLSWVIITWIGVGAIVCAPKLEPLPLSTELCNVTDPVLAANFSSNLVQFNQTQSVISHSSCLGLTPLYAISYTLYFLISCTICILVGVLHSYITGNSETDLPNKKLICSFVWKFYDWKDGEQANQNPLGLELLRVIER